VTGRKRLHCLGAILLVVAVGLSACSLASNTASSASQTFAKVVVRINGDWDVLDGQLWLGKSSAPIVDALYDRLLAYDPAGKIVPYLAKSWIVSPGSVTFALRTDATCSDGTPVTADVVANSFKRLFAPGSKSAAKSLFGSGPFIVTVVDAQHVNINVSNPLTNLLYPMTDIHTSIICPAGLLGGADPNNHSYGSGPYTLVSAIHGDTAVLKVRPEWKWGPSGYPSSDLPQQLVFKVIDNETTAANLLITGGLDIAYVTGADIARLKSEKSLTLQTAYSAGGDNIIFNETEGHPGADPAVREALATSIDPKAWNQAANNGYGKVATSFLGTQVRCYNPAIAKFLPQYSLEKAKGILVAAGYVIGSDGKFTKGGKPLTVNVIGSDLQLAGPDYLVEQFNKLGVTATLNKTTYAIWVSNFVQGKYDVTPYILGSPSPDPLSLMDFLLGPLPPAGVNFSRNYNPVAAQAVKDARAATSDVEKCKAWDTIQRAVLQNHDFLPVAFAATSWFSRSGITFQPGAGWMEAYTMSKKKP
jgi:peptide/nickel transport system substrate-binding protein